MNFRIPLLCLMFLPGLRLCGDLLSRLEQNAGAAAGLPDSVKGAFLTVESEKAAGSAFVATLWKEKVIITNAHVYLRMRDPVIRDLNANVLRVTEVLVSRDRDLVVLGFEASGGGGTQTPLEIEPNVPALAYGEKLTAYGNSLGGGVASVCRGSLKAVGPDIIEIDLPIVHGNSGGPVVRNSDGKVVGVSTYLSMVQPDADNYGTEYFDRRFRPIIRRFATRIDNLTPASLQRVDPGALREDIRILETADRFLDDLLEADTEDKIRSVFRKYIMFFAEAENHEWGSSYMKKVFAERKALYEKILKKLRGAPLLEDFLLRHIAETDFRKIAQREVACFLCGGTGKIIRRNSPSTERNRVSSELRIDSARCTLCGGTGRRKPHPYLWEIVLPEKRFREMGEKTEELPGRFCGLKLGADFRSQLAENPYYLLRRNLICSCANGAGKTFFYRGNPVDRRVEATILESRFGKLTGITLVTGPMDWPPNEVLRIFASPANPPPFLVLPFQSPEQVPCSNQGIPIVGATHAEAPKPEGNVFFRTEKSDDFRTELPRTLYTGVKIICRHPVSIEMDGIDFEQIENERPRSVSASADGSQTR